MFTQSIERASEEEHKKQELLLEKVDALLDETRPGQERLHRNFIQIGIALLEVDRSKAWTIRRHSSAGYIKSCEARFGKGRTALYGFKSVAENLLPHLPEQKLLEIGISKAQPLAQYVKRTGKTPPENLLSDAGNPEVGVDEFKSSIAEAQNEKPEKGKWYDFGGAFLTADE